jgi:hypothetical protein
MLYMTSLLFQGEVLNGADPLPVADPRCLVRIANIEFKIVQPRFAETVM